MGTTIEKVAIVTAGGSGMGAAAARRLAADGFRVAILSSSGKGEALAQELGGIGVTGSNQSNDDLKRLVDSTMSTWGRVDVLLRLLRVHAAVDRASAGCRRSIHRAPAGASSRRGQGDLAQQRPQQNTCLLPAIKKNRRYHPPKPILGFYLQHHWHTRGSGLALPFHRIFTQPHAVWCGHGPQLG